VVVACHLVVEYLALAGGGVRDELTLDNLEDLVTDALELSLDLGLVVTDQGQLVGSRILVRGKRGEAA
jgi:hypothetical protein